MYPKSEMGRGKMHTNSPKKSTLVFDLGRYLTKLLQTHLKDETVWAGLWGKYMCTVNVAFQPREKLVVVWYKVQS